MKLICLYIKLSVSVNIYLDAFFYSNAKNIHTSSPQICLTTNSYFHDCRLFCARGNSSLSALKISENRNSLFLVFNLYIKVITAPPIQINHAPHIPSQSCPVYRCIPPGNSPPDDRTVDSGCI